jgi:hypothetical protein
MLMHASADNRRRYGSFVILLLLFVGAVVWAQTFHFHSQTGTASPTHCTLCEVLTSPLPVLHILVIATRRPQEVVEAVILPGALQSAKGSNLSVRPPPSRS